MQPRAGNWKILFPMSCSGKKACRGGIDIAAGFGDNCKMKLVPGARPWVEERGFGDEKDWEEMG